MSKVNLMVSDTAITVNYDGKIETIKMGDHRFSTVLRAIRNVSGHKGEFDTCCGYHGV